jgi:hypothetical protein
MTGNREDDKTRCAVYAEKKLEAGSWKLEAGS